MSEGKLGNVLITDKDGKLKAVLSDGDLRRALMKEDFSLQKKAIDFANKAPKKCKDKNLLASEALKMIEDFKIQMLVIVDENDKIVGALHIHDLVEAGIK
jgi:arabinose-5-phosphate isomerase